MPSVEEDKTAYSYTNTMKIIEHELHLVLTWINQRFKLYYI